MVKVELSEDDERAPMLRGGQSATTNSKAGEQKYGRRQRFNGGIHGLEIEEGDDISSVARDTASKEGGSLLMQLIRRKFTLLYFGIGAIALIVLAIFLVFFQSMRKMDEKYTKIGSGEGAQSRSEQFMRLYEQLMHFRSSPYVTTNSMIPKLSKDELERAKAAGREIMRSRQRRLGFEGILPLNETEKLNGTEWAEGNRSEFRELHHHRFVWHDRKCATKCEKDDVSIPPLVVISLDGFARDYLDWDIVRSLDKMGECGTSAEFMFPSYPSKTFPNHYSIATGLWPGAHGVVDNSCYDQTISPVLEDMKNIKNAKFFGGEPIWSAAVRQHKRAFCMFWAGCSFNITGYNPTIDVPYDRTMPYSARVDKIVEWLTLPAIERPSLLMAYFDQPDSVDHFHTSQRQVELELSYLESVLDYLFTSLHKEGILDCINLVIVSDHGMQWLSSRYFFNEMLAPPPPGMIPASGVIGRLYFPTNTTEATRAVLDKLTCKDKTKFRVYDQRSLPSRYHYAGKQRIGDVLFDAQLGSTFYASPAEDYYVTSDHGYDYATECMHAVFFARGPNIRRGLRVPPFQNVELFNLFADLMRLTHDVPNNGTLGVLDELVDNMELHRDPLFPLDSAIHPAQECASTIMKRLFHACEESGRCKQRIEELQRELGLCSSQQQQLPNGIFSTRSKELCIINLCPSMLLTNGRKENKGTTTSMFYETLTADDFPRSTQDNPTDECAFFDFRYDQGCASFSPNKGNGEQQMVLRSIAATQKNAVLGFNRLHFQMHHQFANGPLLFLQNQTRHYARKYARIVSITGTIFDTNMDGLADDDKEGNLPPTHFFRILLRCDDGQWHLNGINCRLSGALRVLAFVLPNVRRDLNCLNQSEYLMANTARVRDVELLSGVQFFAERMWYPRMEQLRWRTNITTTLWE